MKGHYEIVKDLEQDERKHLNNKSIPKLKKLLLDLVSNLSIPYDKELLIDIIIDMKKENRELPK